MATCTNRYGTHVVDPCLLSQLIRNIDDTIIQGKLFKSWRRRLFVLTHDALYYYKDDNADRQAQVRARTYTRLLWAHTPSLAHTHCCLCVWHRASSCSKTLVLWSHPRTLLALSFNCARGASILSLLRLQQSAQCGSRRYKLHLYAMRCSVCAQKSKPTRPHLFVFASR